MTKAILGILLAVFALSAHAERYEITVNTPADAYDVLDSIGVLGTTSSRVFTVDAPTPGTYHLGVRAINTGPGGIATSEISWQEIIVDEPIPPTPVPANPVFDIREVPDGDADMLLRQVVATPPGGGGGSGGVGTAGDHHFTGMPLVAGGWHDIDAIIAGTAYDSSRIIFLSSTSGNDSTAGPSGDASPGYYTRAEVPNGGTAYSNPGSVNAYATYATAVAQMRDGFADVLLVERGSNYTSIGIDFSGMDGANASARFIIAAYGTESGAPPIFSYISNDSGGANFGIISSFELSTNATNRWGDGSTNPCTYMLFEDIFYNSTSNATFQPYLGETPQIGNAVRFVRTTHRNWAVFKNSSAAVGGTTMFEHNTVGASYGQHNIYADLDNTIWRENQSLGADGAAFRNRNDPGSDESDLVGSLYFGNLITSEPGSSRFSGTNNSAWDMHRRVLMEYNAQHGGRVGIDMYAPIDVHIKEHLFTEPNETQSGPGVSVLRGTSDSIVASIRGTNIIEDMLTYANNGNYTGVIAVNTFLEASASLTLNDLTARSSSAPSFPELALITSETTLGGSAWSLFSPAATSAWVTGGKAYADIIPSLGSAAASVGAGFSDPDRDLITYLALEGYTASNIDDAVQEYESRALANRRGSWDSAYTPREVIDYLRAGFDLPAIPTNPTLSL